LQRTNEFGSGQFSNTFEGIVNNLERRFRETSSEWVKGGVGGLLCPAWNAPDCHGKRLKPVVLAVTVGGLNISEFCEMSIREQLAFIDASEAKLTPREHQISDQITKEIRNRLQFLQKVGLDYLTLARSAGTLSGGESQRIRLTTHDRQRADRRAVCAGRTQHRPAPARQRQADRHAEKSARPRQHRDRRGAR